MSEYQWDFGDETEAEGIQAVHIYETPGQYAVTLRLTTDDPDVWGEIRKVIGIGYEANKAPSSLRTLCPGGGVAGVPVVFSAAAADPNEDPLTYTWNFGDGGTVITEETRITHAFAETGAYDISVTVTDGRGGEVRETARIEITDPPAGNVAPVAEAGLPLQGAIGGTLLFDGSASYDLNSDALDYSWETGGTVMGGDVSVEYAFQTAGVHTVTLTVTETPDGLSETDTVEVRITDPNDISPPVVTLDLTECPDIYDLYPVFGTVSDTGGGVSYKLQCREKGASSWITFAEGETGTSLSGELGVFDPTVLRNGVHEIRLYAEDSQGNAAAEVFPVIVDGGLKVGQVTIPSADMSLPAPGFPVSLSRQYDSRAQVSGDFGPGWSLPQADVKVTATQIIGEGWMQNPGSDSRGLPLYTLAQSQRHLIVIRFSDTDVVRFEPEIKPAYSTVWPFETIDISVAFSPATGTQGTLRTVETSDRVRYSGGILTTYDGDIYNPTRFEYTRPDGTVYVISENGIESMTDVNGNTVTYGENGITHSSGAGIGFERDTTGRIKTVTGPHGRKTEYHYDENGVLERVIQPGGESFQERMLANYAYQATGERPLIKEIKAPDVTVLGKFEYDSSGRVKYLYDGEENRVLYGYDVENHEQEMTDRRGNVTKYEYDGKGNVTKKTDPLDNVTTWAYDDDGNKLSETNPLGHITTWTYDADGNMLTETDPLGNTTAYVYNERNQMVRKTDPLGNVTEKFYDEKGRLFRTVNPAGGETVIGYDAQGNKVSEEDVLGNVTEYRYNDDGTVFREIRPDDSVTEYGYDEYGNETSVTTRRTGDDGSEIVMTVTKAYDSLNRVTKETYPDGYYTETEYDPVTGKKSLFRDKNGNETTYDYDDQGNLLGTTYPDGKAISHTYDEEGNVLTTTDRAGHTTEYRYDPLNRATEIIHPNGSSISLGYDAGGLTSTTDERGKTTSFEWNAVGKRTKITDALGNETRIEYDANGNKKSVTDAEGNTTAYEYDAPNRRVRTVFPDGTFSSATYHGDGDKKASETDQAGRMTSFGYDSAGRLKDVTDAKGGVTSFTYNEVGNRLTQTDSNGNTKYWYYDDLGRVVRHRLPEGTAEETYVYDPNGNVVEKTDFNGDTVEYRYDGYNRLTKKIYPDASEVSFTYIANGKRKTVTDSRGVTQYDYDALNRLEKVTNPDSTEIAYTYDAKGNRTSVTVPSGRSDYAYDDLNRLKTVTDPDGGVTTYVYNKIGNRKSVTYPNGVVAEYMYDRMHRLIKLENRNSAGDLISGYIYSLGPAGNRKQIEELHSGRVVKYSYDELHRLISEEITDPILGNDTISYSYDAFGNRLTKDGSDDTVTYSYNDNDELETENGSGSTVVYGYDDNGNDVSRNGVIFGYNYENRLVSAGSVQYAYDADGIRVSSSADGSVTDYVMDKNRQYAQVLEERGDASSVSYVYCDALSAGGRAAKPVTTFMTDMVP